MAIEVKEVATKMVKVQLQFDLLEDFIFDKKENMAIPTKLEAEARIASGESYNQPLGKILKQDTVIEVSPERADYLCTHGYSCGAERNSDEFVMERTLSAAQKAQPVLQLKHFAKFIPN